MACKSLFGKYLALSGDADGSVRGKLFDNYPRGAFSPANSVLCTLHSLNMLLHRLFERCAQQHADRDAIVFQDITLTYRDVNTAANRLASHIRQLCGSGRGPENGVVALCLDKSPGMVIAVIAVLKAGLAWVPLPIAAPQAYIQKVLNATQPRLVIASQATRQAIGPDGPRILLLDDAATEAVIKTLPDADLPVEEEHIGPDALCHLIFTSGSTGTPKGVMIEHRGMVHSIQRLTEMFELNQDTRTLQFATYTFDLFGGDLFMTFLAGGCLIMDTLTNIMSDLPAFMRHHRVTYSQLTPTVAALVRPEDVPSLKLFVSSGEPMTAEVLERWGRDGNHGGRIRLLNAYGPTETTIICAVQDMTRPVGVMKPHYVGPGLPNLDLVLVDPDPDSDAAVHGDVPPGTVGELCIAGVQLFRGYIGMPASASSSSFFYRGDKRFYRSGDLGMTVPLNPDDPESERTIHLLGRRDRQVKVHGVRLDLGDVENAVAKFPFTNHCITLVPKAGVVEGRLAAVVSLRDGPGGLGAEPWEHVAVSTAGASKGWDLLLPTAASQQDVLQQLVAEVRTKVQPHAVPSTWLVVSEFPLTTSGKIDRMMIQGWLHTLSEEFYARSVQAWTSSNGNNGEVSKGNGHGGQDVEGEDDDDATISDTTRRLRQQLIEMCSRVLGLPQATIKPRVPLLQLGLDSMAAIRLVSMAHRGGIRLSIQQVLGNNSVADLAQAVSLSPDNPRSSAADTHDDSSANDDEPFALAPVTAEELPALRASVAAECGVEVDDVLDIYPCTSIQGGMMMLSKHLPGTYACEMQFDFGPEVDRDRLLRACQQLETTVPVLRTRVVSLPGPPGRAVQVIIRPGVATGDFDSPMSYGNSLSRFRIKEHPEGKGKGFVLVWLAHHAVYDGWAKILLLRTLKGLYDADGQPTHEPPAPSFRSFIRHIADDKRNREAERLSFWRNYLDGATIPNFPPAPAVDQASTAPPPPPCYPEVLKYTMAVDLFSAARQHRVTPSTILRAASPLVLGGLAGSDDVTMGLILSGRDVPFDGIDRVIGPVFTVVPYRARWDRSVTVSEFLFTQHQASVDMIPHTQFGLGSIRKASDDAERAYHFRCTLVIQPVGGDNISAEPDLAGFVAEQTDGHSTDRVTQTLHIEFIPGATASEGVRVQAMFNPTLTSRAEVLGLFRALERIINRIRAAGSDGGVASSPAVADVVADALAETDRGGTTTTA